ncbi:MAG: NUDIX domain-containing protein [Candidatus Paraimprobicoccus trichonymphae]|uniref:8-oxo-dGTP diphosphatase n=1 Tax=Candidatus Paraimprobicoccus trichonymphae TaxID=3033793 RepID=A0AA48I079_9FIRM|nr:MAG: NUDIX domain-containing protein [Candidatus Paraimprobicoccus trichonymphae]
MEKKFRSINAIFAILEQDNKILLQKRQNTGYMDGLWDVSVSGHVEKNEPISSTVTREIKEEIGIEVTKENIEFVSFEHNYLLGIAHCNFYFKILKFEGVPHICEVEKCSDLKWFNINKLPEDMIFNRKIVIQNYLKGINYNETNWA